MLHIFKHRDLKTLMIHRDREKIVQGQPAAVVAGGV